MDIFASALKWVKDIVLAIIELCRKIKIKDNDPVEDAVIGIVDGVIDGVADHITE